jgi:hypothetical protein
MTSSHSRFPRASAWAAFGLLVLVLALVAAPPSRAGVIYTGNGAGASVEAFSQTAVQSGSTPAAIDTSATVHYTNFSASGNATPGSVTASVNASASATPGGADLFQLLTSFSAPNPGNLSGTTSPYTGVDSGAYWGNVTATVHAPAGSSMPSSIRLEFQVNYAPADVDAYQGLGIRTSYLWFTGSSLVLLPPAGAAIQPGEQPAQTQSNGSLTAGFHLDVPLSASGVSTSPFAVGLTSAFPGITSNSATSISDAISVSLTGIYLPDGASLTAEGYSVSFNSEAGPIQLLPVPEPATWSCWGLIAGCGALMLRRLRARTR